MEIRNPHIAKMATGDIEEDQLLLRFSKYLYTTIRRAASAYWTKMRQIESIETPWENIQSLHDDKVMENRLLLDALHSLTESQRNVLERYYFDECSLKEIAEESGVALTTIYKRLSRALNAMREYLANRGMIE